MDDRRTHELNYLEFPVSYKLKRTAELNASDRDPVSNHLTVPNIVC